MPNTREITDGILIQYIILFTLAKADKKLSHNELSSIILEKCNISFTNFAIALDNLINIDLVLRLVPEEKVLIYALTDKGKQANNFFYRSIPYSIREQILSYIKPFLKKEKEKNSIKSEFVALNETEFMVHMEIQDGDISLMNLDFYAGDRQNAAKMVKNFKKNNLSIYKTILDSLTKEQNEE